METLHDAGTGQFRVRMVAQPASVQTARRFVDEALASWGLDILADDVGLSVSELATNATLHSGGGYFEVELLRTEEGVRVAVVDTGDTPARSIAARSGVVTAAARRDAETLDRLDHDVDAEGMTGRGLFIVSTLATAWGVEDVESGTRVWADFTVDGSTPAPTSPTVVEARPDAELPPGEWHVVRLDGCPPGLLLAHDENLADIVRELQLMRVSTKAGTAVLDEIVGVVRRNAVTWDVARLRVRDALQAGQELVDIAVLAPANVVDEVTRLRAAVDAAEAMAAEGSLITLPVPAPVQRLRAWMQEQFTGQTQGREPVSFADWQAAHPG